MCIGNFKEPPEKKKPKTLARSNIRNKHKSKPKNKPNGHKYSRKPINKIPPFTDEEIEYRKALATKTLEDLRVPLNKDYIIGGSHYPSNKTILHEPVFGNPNRKLCMVYGIVYEMTDIAHRMLHDKGIGNLKLKEMAQREFERLYPDKDFLDIFKINYLDKEK